MSLYDALEARDNSYILKSVYIDMKLEFINNFNAYLTKHKDDFLNDASAHYPNDPISDNVVPLKAQFVEYLHRAPETNSADIGHSEMLMKCIWLMFEACGHHKTLKEEFPTLIIFWEKLGSDERAFVTDARKILGIRETLLSWEKLAHIGNNLQSALYVSEAGH
jgi:hypothetical protein